MRMTIKNVIQKPTVTITKLGVKPTYMDDIVYAHLQNNLNKPLPVSSIHYFKDGRLCSVSVYLPELEYIIDDVQPPLVTCEVAMFFNDENVEMSLAYID